MATIPPAVSVDNVTVIYPIAGRDLLALDRVDLTLRQNEFVCIVGPSGCGKTTLLKVVAGMVGPTSGRAVVSGRSVTGPGPDRAVVFQEDALFPWMTVWDNVAFSQRMRGTAVAQTEATVQRYLDLVGLVPFARAWPKQMSGGMKKRVDLARAYACEPEVLLMDEPFAALDVITKERLQEEFSALWGREPRTVMFVTHDIEEALFLGDRVALMATGPGRIDKVYPVPWSRPREGDLRLASDFVTLRREIGERMLANSASHQSSEETS